MMKIVKPLLAVLIIFCLCSCGAERPIQSAGQTEAKTQSSAEAPVPASPTQSYEMTEAVAPESHQEEASSRRSVTLAEMVELAPYIFTAKYKDGPDQDGFTHFSVLSGFRGNLSGTISFLCPDFTPDPEAEYLLFAERFTNVMKQTDYLVLDGYVVQKNDALQSLLISDLKGQSYTEILQKMPDLVQAFPTSTPSVHGAYIHSEDIRVIAQEADAVVFAKVEAITKTLEDRLWCRLTNITAIKGSGVSPDSNIIVPVGSIEEGTSYYFCLQDINGYIGFIIAAPNSIYLPESEEGQYLSTLK